MRTDDALQLSSPSGTKCDSSLLHLQDRDRQDSDKLDTEKQDKEK